MNVGGEPTTLHSLFRPYFYRGCGEDVLEETLRQAALDLERERYEVEARAERRRLRQQAEAVRKYELLTAKVKADAMREAQAALAEMEAEDAEPEWVAPVIQLFPKAEFPETPAPTKPVFKREPKPPQPRGRYGYASSSPISTDDIEGLLDDD